jgi:hypothetical protein
VKIRIGSWNETDSVIDLGHLDGFFYQTYKSKDRIGVLHDMCCINGIYTGYGVKVQDHEADLSTTTDYDEGRLKWRRPG